MEGTFFLTNWIFLGMRWLFDNLAGNIVLTVILSTIIVRCLTVFGDIKSRKSSIKMQEIQPDLEKIKKKYGDNPQKVQQAQSKLMKERGVSMFGGCLPILITMPLFICFIAAFRFWGYEMMIKALLELHETGSSELFSTFKFLWVHNIWQPDSGLADVVMGAKEFLSIPELGKLIFFAEHPDKLEIFKNLGFLIQDTKNIPQASIDMYNSLMAPIVTQYAGFKNGWFFLPLLAGATSMLSSWIMQKNQPKPVPGKDGKTPNTGKMMMYLMPIMSVFFCLSANAAFAIYWTISNVVALCTNLILNKHFKKAALSKEETKQ